MWGVLVFLKLPALVKAAGLLPTLAAIGCCAGVQLLNCVACSAVATNGLHQGVNNLLVAQLGPAWGSSASILYYGGMSALATVEICGAVEALDLLVSRSLGDPYLTLSVYTDLGVIGTAGLFVIALVRAFMPRVVHTIGQVVLAAFGLTLLTTVVGALRSFRPEHIASNFLPPRRLSYAELRLLATFTYPCFAGIFQPVNKSAELKTPHETIPRAMIRAVLTSAAALALVVLAVAGSAPADRLDEDAFILDAWPSEYVGLVGTIVVGIGSCVSCIDVAPTILQSIASDHRMTLLRWIGLHRSDGDNAQPLRAVGVTFVLAAPFAWMTLDKVALYASLLFLQMYATMDICCAVLHWLHSPGWRPKFPPRTWPLATVATAAAVGCVATVYALGVPVWLLLVLCGGPAVFFTWLSGSGDLSGSTAGSTSKATGSNAFRGLLHSLALQALQQLEEGVQLAEPTPAPRSTGGGAVTEPTPDSERSQRLKALQWRPQLLCLLPSPPMLIASEESARSSARVMAPADLRTISAAKADAASRAQGDAKEIAELGLSPRASPRSALVHSPLDDDARQVLGFAQILKEGQGITILATVVRERESVPERDLFSAAKARLARLARSKRLVCFVDATVSTAYDVAVGVLINCVGVGALRPNTLLLGWRTSPPTSDRGSHASAGLSEPGGGGGASSATDLLVALEKALGFDKAVLIYCHPPRPAPTVGTGGSPQAPRAGTPRMGFSPRRAQERQRQAGGGRSYIDVWWIDHCGSLPVILAELIQRHDTLARCSLRFFVPEDGPSPAPSPRLTPASPSPPSSVEESVRKAEEGVRRLLDLYRIQYHSVEVVPGLDRAGLGLGLSGMGGPEESISPARISDRVSAMVGLNEEMLRRRIAATSLVICDLPLPAPHDSASPRGYTRLLDLGCAGLGEVPVLWCHGGPVHASGPHLHAFHA